MPTPNGPLEVQGIQALKNHRGEPLDAGGTAFLCRCGASNNKPFCDGSHETVGFSDQRPRANKDPVVEAPGQAVTVVDDFSLCAHAGECVDGAPETFFTQEAGRRVSHPDASPAEQVIATIRRCPSGSLLYRLRGGLVHEYFTDSEVLVQKDGPLHVHRTKLRGDAKPATEDHYALCRCGASGNKPFCDGRHTKIKFRDGSAA